MSWQVCALVEVIGALRGRLAQADAYRRRERAELEQKLEAAKDALRKLQLNESIYGQQLAKGYEEIDHLKSEVVRLERERDDARQLLDLTSRPSGEPIQPVLKSERVSEEGNVT